MRSETGVIRDVILPEGTTLRLRAATRDDAAGLLAFVEPLSPESRYFRFHGLPPVGPRLVEPFLDPDWDERGALVGTLGAAEEADSVALGTWSRLRDRTGAEAAFAVDDEFQGHGIGTRLVEQLAGLAAEAGIERFVAEVLSANLSMLRVFEHVGFAVTRELEGGVVEVVFPIAPTESYRETVDSRDHLGVVASLGPFFSPRVESRSTAPLRRAGTIGGLVFRNIVEGGFTGERVPGESPRGRRRRRGRLHVADRGSGGCRPGGLLSARQSTCSRQWRTRWRRAYGRSASSPPDSPR